MTNTELIQEGINLMFSGMGFVLIFLLILIFAIGLMSKIINRFFPEPIVPSQIQPQAQTTQCDNLERLRPVIVAAIAHHRRQQGF